ncbi:MAG: hypothetical protein QOG20_4905, partial [Pseudonocardiales bacterium]|nr:hypothetical protein [Pseudonocardiales bacterium]
MGCLSHRLLRIELPRAAARGTHRETVDL